MPPEPRRRNQAFSAVEMMIALGVVGVLLLIAVPSYRNARIQSQTKKAEADLALIATAVRQLMWDTGKFPSGLSIADVSGTEVWSLTPTNAGLVGATSIYTGWRGPYLRKITNDPWGMPYFFDPDYRINGVDKIVVGSFGPNRVGRNIYDSDNVYVILN